MTSIDNKQKSKYLAGFIGAVFFSFPAVIITIGLCYFFEIIVGWIIVLYIFLAKKGYKLFDGKEDTAGKLIAIGTAFSISIVGIIVGYILATYKNWVNELKGILELNFSLFWELIKENTEIQVMIKKYLLINCGISMGVSLVAFFLSGIWGKDKGSKDKGAETEKYDAVINDKWICNKCGTVNEIYLPGCKKCGKEINIMVT